MKLFFLESFFRSIRGIGFADLDETRRSRIIPAKVCSWEVDYMLRDRARKSRVAREVRDAIEKPRAKFGCRVLGVRI